MAALEVLASKDQVVCLRGAAGVGKTTVLAEIWREVSATGVPVFACAPTTSAAHTLRKDGLPATTLTEFLQNLAFREQSRLQNAVLVVDESGLTSNCQGAELLQLAKAHSARILFIGDSRQHSSVEAGDFLRVLETHSHIHRVELGAIRRQEHQAYREAVACLATGAARLGMERLDDLGWIKEGKSNYIRAAAADFARLAIDPKAQVLAVTPTWTEQEAFTQELRSMLKATGSLGPLMQVTVHEPLAVSPVVYPESPEGDLAVNEPESVPEAPSPVPAPTGVDAYPKIQPFEDFCLLVAGNEIWRVKDACEGVIIFGATGSGKTSGSGQTLAREYLRAGFGGLVLCAKPDEPALWVKYASQVGRESDLILFGTDHKWSFNFLEHESRRQGAGASLTENLRGLAASA